MTLFGAVSEFLAREDVPCAVIGASALAVHGVSRSTYDINLLAVSPRVLEKPFWEGLDAPSATIDIRHGDQSDPLRGVVRISQPEQRDVDIVVGRHQWQRDAIARAERARLLDKDVLVVCLADLILLKLFAGGGQDLWDIEQLLPSVGAEMRAQVDKAIDVLPAESRAHWIRLTAC